MERSKRAKSSKQAKRDAVRAQILAKKQGSSGGRLDEVEIADEGLVYDEVDESEYEAIVNARREREDFVVDDDGLGYHDDGEEHFGDRETDGKKEAVKAKRGINASLDEGALKKARMLNADRGKEDGQGSSMLGFVRMGEKTEGAKLGQVSRGGDSPE
jgi:DNA polymerase alpha subunit A